MRGQEGMEYKAHRKEGGSSRGKHPSVKGMEEDRGRWETVQRNVNNHICADRTVET